VFGLLLLALGEPFVLHGPGHPAVPSDTPLENALFLDWTRPLPGASVDSASHTERSGPVAFIDQVYLGSAGHSALFQLHRASGAEQHRYPAKAPVQSEALVDEYGLFFCDTAGYTFHYSHGETSPIWEHFGGAPIVSSPALGETRIYIATVDDLVYALDRETGELAWRYQRPPDAARSSALTLLGTPSPTLVGDVVLYGFSDGTLLALDRETGVLAWERQIGEGRYPDLVAAPVVADGAVFVAGYTQPLVALDLDNLAVRWRLPHGSAAAPILEGEWLYHPGTDGRLRKVHARNGTVAWTWDSNTTGALTTPSLTAAGLLTTSSEGSLYLVDPDTGQTRWDYAPDVALQGITARPMIQGRQVIAVTNAGNVLSLISPSSSTDIPDWLQERL
jgi:hypothetical protein